MEDDVIDKAAFFNASNKEQQEQRAKGKPKSTWVCADLRPVPAFYPLEKSSRFVDDEKDMVTDRLAECLRVLSVQAEFSSEVVRSANVECQGMMRAILVAVGPWRWSFCGTSLVPSRQSFLSRGLWFLTDNFVDVWSVFFFFRQALI